MLECCDCNGPTPATICDDCLAARAELRPPMPPRHGPPMRLDAVIDEVIGDVLGLTVPEDVGSIDRRHRRR